MKKFDYELERMQHQLSDMGDLAKAMVERVGTAVDDRSLDVQEELDAMEKRLNKMQTDIDQDAIRMLTVYGPVATDLRNLLATTHITSQLERMGDQTMNIVEALRLMRSDPATHPLLPTVCKMSTLVCEMIDDALDAYFSRNVDKAAATRLRDDIVDALNEQVMKELFTDEVLREVLSGATDIGDAVAQILVARYFERIADQATNICKQVIYMIKGDDVRHSRS